MSRLSRDQKRGRSAAGAASNGRAGSGSGTAPIEVRVPADARDGTPGAPATVGGIPVLAGPGEPVQQAVLNHLHRLALATGRPVLASVQDERIGYVVPIRVHADGSSEFTGEPVRMGATPAVPAATGGEAEPRDTATQVLRVLDAQVPAPGATASTSPLSAVRDPEAPPATPSAGVEARTHALRAVPEPMPAQSATPAPQPAPAQSATPAPQPAPAQSATPAPQPTPAPSAAAAPQPTPAPSAVPAPHPERTPSSEPDEAAEVAEPADGAPERPGATVGTFVLRAVPETGALITATSGPAQALPGAPGTVSPPTGTFGPPPVVPAPPAVDPAPPSVLASASAKPPTWPTPAPSSVETPEVAAPPLTDAGPSFDPDTEADEIKEPPVREFDSVAEAVLGVESGTAPSAGADGPLAEPMARINAAVKQGRIEEAAGLAEQAVAESTAGLGSDHPDVLRLRELTAYIAYLAGDPLRSFHLSLELSQIRHRLGDPRGAYGNVQSAAAAWRAVRDPIQGLHLGRDLIAVWTSLAAEEGPAADDLDQLERARSRMDRLAERARGAAGAEQPSAR